VVFVPPTTRILPSVNRACTLWRRLVFMLPVFFHCPGLSFDAAGMIQVRSPTTRKPTITNDKEMTRFMLMTSFFGNAQDLSPNIAQRARNTNTLSSRELVQGQPNNNRATTIYLE
jgi:hypothetical protein